tara:strand:+ start:1175 stop:1591 length:417 start_codon:yes stop_codon:yes gene_type:complete
MNYCAQVQISEKIKTDRMFCSSSGKTDETDKSTLTKWEEYLQKGSPMKKKKTKIIPQKNIDEENIDERKARNENMKRLAKRIQEEKEKMKELKMINELKELELQKDEKDEKKELEMINELNELKKKNETNETSCCIIL